MDATVKVKPISCLKAGRDFNAERMCCFLEASENADLYDLEGYKNMLIILPTPNPSQEGNLLIGKGRLIPLLGGVRGG